MTELPLDGPHKHFSWFFPTYDTSFPSWWPASISVSRRYKIWRLLDRRESS